jgi:hypothetical protein
MGLIILLSLLGFLFLAGGVTAAERGRSLSKEEKIARCPSQAEARRLLGEAVPDWVGKIQNRERCGYLPRDLYIK